MYVRKLRIMWYFYKDHREPDVNPFKKKSKFNPKWDAPIEMNLNRLEKNILFIDEKISSYSNQEKEQRNGLYLLRDDSSIIIKEADKTSVLVVLVEKVI